MAEWIWILIPLTAIGLGGFKEWLKFKSKQDRLGHSTHELEGTVSTLSEALADSEAERKRLTERLQNLETIVTSQAWDALHEGEPLTLPEQERTGFGAASTEKEEHDSAQKAETLARRMQV